MIYCPYVIKKADGSELVIPRKDILGDLEGNIFRWILLRNTVGAPTMLFRKKIFLEIGGFDSSYASLEDWDFVIRFAKRQKIGYLNEVLVSVKESPHGISSGIAAYFEARCKRIAAYREDMVKEGVFDGVVVDLFERAKMRGILDPVKQMLMAYLK